ARVVVDRIHAAARQIDDEQAVAVLHLRVDGVREQISLLVERDLTDAAEELVVAGVQVVENDVGATWTSCALGRSIVAGGVLSARRPPAGCGPPPRSPAAAAGRRAAARRAAAQHDVIRARRERERLHVLPRLDVPGREIPKLDAPRLSG